MYCRQFKDPPENIIEKHKAHFGTFSSVSPKIDIRGMRAPYAGIPFPTFITKIRIKSRINYVFTLDNYIGLAQIIDFKALGLAEIILWNKENGKKYVYHTIMPPRRRFIPIITKRGICATYQKSRFIKISWGRNHKHGAMTFSVKGDSARPKAEGYFYSKVDDDFHTDCMFVNPSPTQSRCSVTWFTTMAIKGHITINGEQADDSNGLAIMTLNRAYIKVHSKIKVAYGIGVYKEKKIAFELKNSNLDAADSDRYNDNVLVVDGKQTALPPVYMTHPFGIDKSWVIQDTESMVDLSFTPLSSNSRTLNIIALRSTDNMIYGTYDGVLLTTDGEKITLKNFPGILYRNLIRI